MNSFITSIINNFNTTLHFFKVNSKNQYKSDS